METLETNVINNNNLDISIYKRYVDDIFLTCKSEDITEILNAFNIYHKNIQFTLEIEKNKTLNFLDVSVIRKNNNILKTNWYTKPQYIGRYINAHSITPTSFKINTINNLIDKALKFSDIEYRNQNLNKIKMALLNNNYNETFINKLIKRRVYYFYNKTKLKNINKNKNSTKPTGPYINIPYLGNFTEQIKKILKKYEHNNLAMKPYFNLKPFYHKHLDKIPVEQRSGLVYKTDCENCHMSYIGQTKNRMYQRIIQHRSNIKNKTFSTALSKHAIELNHKFNFQDYKILNIEHNNYDRNFAEMCFIKTTKHTINHRTDIDNLNSMYYSILKNTYCKTPI